MTVLFEKCILYQKHNIVLMISIMALVPLFSRPFHANSTPSLPPPPYKNKIHFLDLDSLSKFTYFLRKLIK